MGFGSPCVYWYGRADRSNWIKAWSSDFQGSLTVPSDTQELDPRAMTAITCHEVRASMSTPGDSKDHPRPHHGTCFTRPLPVHHNAISPSPSHGQPTLGVSWGGNPVAVKVKWHALQTLEVPNKCRWPCRMTPCHVLAEISHLKLSLVVRRIPAAWYLRDEPLRT